MRKFKAAAVVATALAVLLSMTGCGLTTFDNFKATFIDKEKNKVESIQIGVLEPVTGADSQDASKEIRGMQIAAKVHPEVNGKKVELVFADNKSDIYSTETAVETLLAKEPEVILGSYGSVYSLAAGDKIRDAGIPAIAATNTNPLVTKNNPYYFRVCYADAKQGALLARYVLESRNEKTAGILGPENDDAATAIAKEFKDKMRQSTDNEDAILYNESYKAGDKDFSEQLNKLKDSGVKAVLLPGDLADSQAIISQAAKMNLDVQFLGDTEWGDKNFLKGISAGGASEQVAFVQFFSGDGEVVESSVALEQEAFSRMAAEEGLTKQEMEDDRVALGYDAYMVAISAIETAGDGAEGKDIKAVLADQSQTYVGVSGIIRFDSYGDPVKTAYINTWDNGSQKTLYTVEGK
ncbi:MAG: ABC transporter substrate-binding protein [Lentihominibacter sp.]